MNEKALHINFFVNTITEFFNTFWFMFLFLLVLNVLDVITGEIKAKYLKVESSRVATKGLYKKIFLWILITITLGLSLMFIQIGEIFHAKIGFMSWLGRLVVIHAIINEFRSIIENIVACDKGNIVPSWLKKGLEVTQRTIDGKSENFFNKIETTLLDENLQKKIVKLLQDEQKKQQNNNNSKPTNIKK